MQDNALRSGNKQMSATWSPLQIEFSVTLEGSVVRLEPVRLDHAAQLWQVAKDHLNDIFRWFPYRMRTREDFDGLVANASAEQEGCEVTCMSPIRARNNQASHSKQLRVQRCNELNARHALPQQPFVIGQKQVGPSLGRRRQVNSIRRCNAQRASDLAVALGRVSRELDDLRNHAEQGLFSLLSTA